MIVTIKFIAGQEIDLEVESDFTISSIKELVSRQFNVPVEQQRLVFKGKILADAQCLCDYNIVAGTKLHLTVKKVEPRNYAAEDDKARDKLVSHLRSSLRNHFAPADVEKVVEQFSQELDKQVANSSLDDIERVSASGRSGHVRGVDVRAASSFAATSAAAAPSDGPGGGGLSKAGALPIKNAKNA